MIAPTNQQTNHTEILIENFISTDKHFSSLSFLITASISSSKNFFLRPPPPQFYFPFPPPPPQISLLKIVEEEEEEEEEGKKIWGEEIDAVMRKLGYC